MQYIDNDQPDVVTGTITLPSPIGIANDPVTNRVYVTNTFAHTVSVLAGSR